MVTHSQTGRFLKIETPLGPDAVLLEGLTGHEALSQPFEFELRLLAVQPVAFDRVLGQRATLTIEAPGCPVRRLCGVIMELAEVEEVAGPTGLDSLLRYTARFVPRFWLLTQSRRQRIWQRKTVPEIVMQILCDEWRLDVRAHFAGSYRPRNFCVQYAESDFDFVNRLLEEEGVRYYFEHTSEGDVLILGDRWTHVDAVPEPSHVPYRRTTEDIRTPCVTAWGKTQRVTVLKHGWQDHSFEMPSQVLRAQAHAPEELAIGRVTHRFLNAAERMEADTFPCGVAHRYDSIGPGGTAMPDELTHLFEDVERLASMHACEQAARSLILEGRSTAVHLEPGRRFTLEHCRDADGDYLLTFVEHEATLEGAYLTGGEAGAFRYRNRFRCLPASMLYYPPRRTPRPFVRGPQTATVVSPEGKDVSCDKYGRVRVRFHWEGGGDPGSCWLRVAQAWAGRGYGALHLPRVGQEVVVDFQDGDPDRPIILGSVYNAEQMPPYQLPDEIGQTGIRSQFLDGNGRYSELCFSDTRGQEGLQLRSNHDLHTICDNNHHTDVGSGYGIRAGSAMNIVIGSDGGSGSNGSGSGGGGWEVFKESWTSGWSLQAPEGWEIYWGDYKQTVLGLGLYMHGSRIDMNLGGTLDMNLGYRYDWVAGMYKQTHFGASSLYATSESKIVGTTTSTIAGVSYLVSALDTVGLAANFAVILRSMATVSMTCGVGCEITLTPATATISSLGGVVINGTTDISMSIMNVPIVTISPYLIRMALGATAISITEAGINFAVPGHMFTLNAMGLNEV